MTLSGYPRAKEAAFGYWYRARNVDDDRDNFAGWALV